MATIDLSTYKSSAKKSSILGYSSSKGWTLYGTSKPAGYEDAITFNNDPTDVYVVSTASAAAPLTINATTGENWKIDDSVGGAKTINTGNGNDYVTVGSANASINVGDGNDSVSVKNALDGASINLGAGNDVLDLGANVAKTTIQLGAGEATVNGGSADVTGSTINGTGKNKIELKDVKDTRFNLGSGNDSVTVNSATSDTFTLGAGNNVVSVKGASKENSYTFLGGDDSLTLGGTSTSDTVTMGAGKDSVSVVGAVDGSSFKLGAGDDSLTFDVDVKEATIDMGDGADTVTVKTSVTGGSISMGAGNDSLVLTAGAKNATIDLGAGNDTVTIIAEGTGTSITGGAGSDVFDVKGLTSGTATITDFQATTDQLVVDGKDITAMGNTTALKADGTITLASKGTVQLSSKAGYYAVTAVTVAGGDKTNVIWTGEKAVEVNASAIAEPMLIVGTTGEGADTLRGGTKVDTIVAGEGDIVFGGGGDDSINLGGGAAVDSVREIVALVNGAGADSVVNFKQGFNDTDDAIYLAENSISDIARTAAFDTTGTNLVVKLGTSKLDLAGVTAAGTTHLNVSDKSKAEYDVAVLADKQSDGNGITDVDAMADYYIATGDTATLDFSGIGDTLNIELGNTGVYGGSSTFVGNITSVTGGKGTTVLLGDAKKKETLVAGGGQTSLWGGGSAADTLVGASADTKTTFFYRAGDGKDEVQGKNWGNGDAYDVLDLTGVALTSIKTDAVRNIVINTANASDKLTVTGTGSENDIVNFTTDGKTILQGKYGVTDGSTTNNFVYESDVDVYYGGKSDTLTVGSDITSANIQLDGSQGVGYAGIKTVDASSNNGELIIGGTGAASESILAGTGSSSIWGGAGDSKDTLVGGGSGSTTFYWGTGNGNDTITNTTSSDKVFFYNVSSTAGTVTEIKDTVDSGSTMVFTLATGEKLTVSGLNSSSVSQFTFADGVTYNYDYSAEAGKRWSIAGQQA